MEEKLGDVYMALSEPIESQRQYQNALKRLQTIGLTIQGLKSNSEKPKSSNNNYNSKNAILRIVTKLGDADLQNRSYHSALMIFEEVLEEIKRRAHIASAGGDTEDIFGEIMHYVHGRMAKCHREIAITYARLRNYKAIAHYERNYKDAMEHYEKSINLMDQLISYHIL